MPVAALAIALLITAAPTAAGQVLQQIDEIVTRSFYSKGQLAHVDWPSLVEKARAKLASARSEDARDAILEDLVAGLKTSHTEYLPRSRPEYWDIASIFESFLKNARKRCAPGEFPPAPVKRDGIGVFWKRIEGRWFVGGVLDGGPAAKAGLHAGDEIVQAGGSPFSPVGSLEGRAGRLVRLSVRRASGGPLHEIPVKPARLSPQAEFRDAIGTSARIIERAGARIGYVRVWSWAGEEMQSALREAINDLNGKKMTAFILDERDGWGGASPHYLDVFDTRPPVVVSTSRGGRTISLDAQVRVPAVLLVNGGSRSGKEVVAYGVKKHHLATLVGTNTAGAVLPGTPYCLKNGALLYLAAGALTVDGEVLEGRGVAPDVVVPFDVRYSDGEDPQLERALEILSASSR
ncbi:MAG: S41 family peptidase [Myxococcales bacterium]